MSGLWGHLVGVLIVVMMTVFIGIWFWAWRPRHRRVFDALAAIPMLDDRPIDIAADAGVGDETDVGDETGNGNERARSAGSSDRRARS